MSNNGEGKSRFNGTHFCKKGQKISRISSKRTSSRILKEANEEGDILILKTLMTSLPTIENIENIQNIQNIQNSTKYTANTNFLKFLFSNRDQIEQKRDKKGTNLFF